jgi:hypothetical protein
LAKDEIREVIYRVAKGTDRKDADLIASGYHPDGVDDHGVFYGTGKDFSTWCVATTQGTISQHFLGQIIIELDGDKAYSESYVDCHVLMRPYGRDEDMDMFHGCRYLDKFERRDGGPWLISHRLLCWDWAYYIPAGDRFDFVVPGEDSPRDSGFVWGAYGRADPSYHIAEFPLPRPS